MYVCMGKTGISSSNKRNGARFLLSRVGLAMSGFENALRSEHPVRRREIWFRVLWGEYSKAVIHSPLVFCCSAVQGEEQHVCVRHLLIIKGGCSIRDPPACCGADSKPITSYSYGVLFHVQSSNSARYRGQQKGGLLRWEPRIIEVLQ